MAEDTKYKFENGQFVNRVSGEAIPDDEPVIIFRARDIHAVDTLWEYFNRLPRDPRSSHHLKAVIEKIEDFQEYARTHPLEMKEPGITGHYRLRRG
jgi:hypothetical protein